MRKTLKLRKMGCDFIDHDEITSISDCKNYRLKDILKCVNEIANIPYTDIEII